MANEQRGNAMTYLAVTFTEWWQQLDVLPPACRSGRGFLVGEPVDLRKCEVDGVLANTYYAYFGTGNEGERDWKAARPLTIAEFRRANKTFPPAGAK
jgi:hypothetical protein